MNDSMLPGNRPEPKEAPSPESGGSGGGGGGGFARSATMAVGRGTLLVGLAVVIGILLLQVVDPGPDGSNASTGTTSSTTATGSSTTVAGETTTAPGDTTTAVTSAAGGARPPAEVSVIVFNGSNATGVAGNATTKLKNAGYKTLAPTDAQTKQTGTTTACKPEFKADAPGIVAIVGGKAVDYPASPTPAAASANCFVIIGS